MNYLIPPPELPKDSPFTESQKQWLKGFFDGLSAIQPNDQTSESLSPSGPQVTILWGSQTGTSEMLAKKVAKKLTTSGCITSVLDMADTNLADLSCLSHLAIITSTYGDGEPPDNAAALHSELMNETSPFFESTSFSVLALGDSSYPDFCQSGKDFDQRLEALGAKRMTNRVDCDVDYDDQFESWTKSLIASFTSLPA